MEKRLGAGDGVSFGGEGLRFKPSWRRGGKGALGSSFLGVYNHPLRLPGSKWAKPLTRRVNVVYGFAVIRRKY